MLRPARARTVGWQRGRIGIEAGIAGERGWGGKLLLDLLDLLRFVRCRPEDLVENTESAGEGA
jgi:hypothetical protein